MRFRDRLAITEDDRIYILPDNVKPPPDWKKRLDKMFKAEQAHKKEQENLIPIEHAIKTFLGAGNSFWEGLNEDIKVQKILNLLAKKGAEIINYNADNKTVTIRFCNQEIRKVAPVFAENYFRNKEKKTGNIPKMTDKDAKKAGREIAFLDYNNYNKFLLNIYIIIQKLTTSLATGCSILNDNLITIPTQEERDKKLLQYLLQFDELFSNFYKEVYDNE